jgi:multiple sugar transport system permease protein
MSAQSNEIPIKLYGLRRGTVTALTLLSALFALFILIPIVWLVINSTKTQVNLFQTFGFWFASPFAFFDNFGRLFEDIGGNGTYIRWFGNTAFYAFLGGGGATVLCTLAGYGFARYRFRGSQMMFYLVMAALMVPITAITFPLFLVYTKVGLINSIWGLILPSMLTPVGMYIMRTYVQLSVPRELMDAARLDGAGEVRIFFRIALPLIVPGVMTVLLIAIVAVWNNYFLPLLIFSRNELFPLTQGMGVWSSQAASTSGTDVLYPMIVIGGLVTIVPLVTLFLILQRYWRGGLLLGSIAN